MSSYLTQNWKNLSEKIDLLTKKKKRAPEPIKIVVAGKYGSAEQIKELVTAGATHIGENRVLDAVEKLKVLAQQQLPRFERHLIGTLQTNKVKKAVEWFDCIQSLDRPAVFEAVNEECRRTGKKIDGFIQVNTSGELTKSGFSEKDAMEFLPRLMSFPNIRIVGIMMLAPYSDRPEDARPHFQKTRRLFETMNRLHPAITELSMGMSHDFQVAIEEGATMIRVGSILFRP